MKWHLLKTGFLILLIIFLITSMIRVSADETVLDGKKSIHICYKINNMDEYNEYVFLKLVKSNTNSYYILNNDSCVMSSGQYHSGPTFTEYVTRAIPSSEFNESNFDENASDFEDFFGNNSNMIYPNSYEIYFSRISKNHPLDSAVVNAEISNINETCFEVTKISVNYTYTDGTYEEKYFTNQNVFPTPSKGIDEDAEIPLIWFIAIPLVALIGIIIVILKRKRK